MGLMKLKSQLDTLAADKVAATAGTSMRCITSNFRWECALTEQRSTDYNDFIDPVDNHQDWKAEHRQYVDACIHVAKDAPASAECFAASNQQAHLNEIDNTLLLRLESVGYLFHKKAIKGVATAFWDRFYHNLKDLKKDTLPIAADSLRTEFINQWNAQRVQARPMFTTFLNDFGGNLGALIKQDWPHIMRDRLGLTHLQGSATEPLPVILVCYSVDEVRAAQLMAAGKGATSGFTRPTVLDMEMSDAFIPAPTTSANTSYGHTLDLACADIPSQFTPEMLTFPLDYQAKHIKALGFITREHALHDEQALLDARNRHIQGLQRQPDCADFGEVLL